MADVQGSALCHGSTPGALFKMSELKVGDVANEQNLKPVRTKSEARERGRKGGKASGAARRRKADFRRTLNMLLTAEIDNEEWKPVLSHLELSVRWNAMLMAQIKEAVKGNTKAAYFVAQYAGQNGQTEADDEEQRIRTDRAKRARDQEVGDTESNDDNIQSFLNAMRPSQQEMDQLFEEGEDDAEETEETGEV